MKRAVTLHLALVSAHPTEADARQRLVNVPADTPYLGRWIPPRGEREPMHVLSADATAADLEREGWERA